MPIKPGDLQFRDDNNNLLVSGKLNNLFPDARLGDPTDYTWLQIENRNATLTMSSVKVWLKPDSRGATVAIALDSTNGVISTGSAFSSVNIAGLSYSTPTTRASGLSVGNMAPETQCRIGIRRAFTGSSPAVPENNRIYVGGTSPL